MSKVKPGSQTILFKMRSPNYYSSCILPLFFGGCALFYYPGKLVLLLEKCIQATLTVWGSSFLARKLHFKLTRQTFITVSWAHVIKVFTVTIAKCMGDTSIQLNKMIVLKTYRWKGRLDYDRPVGQSI